MDDLISQRELVALPFKHYRLFWRSFGCSNERCSIIHGMSVFLRFELDKRNEM